MVASHRMMWACRIFGTAMIRISVIISTATAGAGEIQLKNGTVLTGNLWLMERLADSPTGGGGRMVELRDANTHSQNIVLIDNGWRKCYIPRRQFLPQSLNLNFVPNRGPAYEFPLPPKLGAAARHRFRRRIERRHRFRRIWSTNRHAAHGNGNLGRRTDDQSD